MAVSEEARKQYTPTIGIECHVQLKTKTKLFSAVGNDARQAPPNTLISHIDVGMPGALPVLNEKALELAVRAAFVLNTEPQKFSKFDRKHYFYPDLPKGYQISQYDQPIIKGGYVEIDIDGQNKRVNITRVHMEEDAGKNIHPSGASYSLVDLNRAGTPLLEIVSEPDIHSAAEAKAYARELYLLMKYAEISDADLYHGNIRFDVNISVSKDPGQKGIRAEVKNLNSFRSVENAVLFEIDRQIELLESGEQIIQETRGWDEDKQKTTSQRSKEEAHDYRYMPEPDIPPIVLEQTFIDKIKAEIPVLPSHIRNDLSRLNLSKNVLEDVLDSPAVYQKISSAIKLGTSPESIRRIVFDSLEEPKSLNVSIEDHIELADMLTQHLISSTAGKEILKAKINNPERSVGELVEGKKQVSDEGEIENIVSEVIAENPKAAEDVAGGEMKAIGFLVGQVMKKSQGKANPGLAQEIIKKQLGIS
jgi:aspartyl-tRNA(Asn)/glutamyl-tRNA(Gln) amidotransferase subunit B